MLVIDGAWKSLSPTLKRSHPDELTRSLFSAISRNATHYNTLEPCHQETVDSAGPHSPRRLSHSYNSRLFPITHNINPPTPAAYLHPRSTTVSPKATRITSTHSLQRMDLQEASGLVVDLAPVELDLPATRRWQDFNMAHNWSTINGSSESKSGEAVEV